MNLKNNLIIILVVIVGDVNLWISLMERKNLGMVLDLEQRKSRNRATARPRIELIRIFMMRLARFFTRTL